jgi:glycosyltransferase involved in cell wall biosynthesis
VSTIYVNGRFLSQRVTGVQRAAGCLLEAIGDRLSSGRSRVGADWEVLAPRADAANGGVPALPGMQVRRVGTLRGHAWEQLELPYHARGGVLLNLCNTAPVAARSQVAVVYDASVFAAPAGYSWPFRTWYRALLPAVGRVATTVVAPSEFSRRQLAEHAGMDRDKIEVVHLGCDHVHRVEPDRSILQRLGIGHRPYVLGVSSLNPNKNFAGFARAVEMLAYDDVDVVVAGGRNDRVFRGVKPAAGPLRYTGYISDAELYALYGSAACLVFPSLYEGFGFPPLEAMALGCPVVSSDRASLPEVCGGAALYCDADDAADIATQVDRVLGDESLARELRESGRERAAQFTWDRTAAAVEEIVHRAGAQARQRAATPR